MEGVKIMLSRIGLFVCLFRLNRKISQAFLAHIARGGWELFETIMGCK